jgi:hypothetical protein
VVAGAGDLTATATAAARSDYFDDHDVAVDEVKNWPTPGLLVVSGWELSP